MKIDQAQFHNILKATYGTDDVPAIDPGDAELIIAVAQLAVAADRVENPDERALFAQLASHVYAAATLQTSPPSLAVIDDDGERLEQLRTHAMQLQGKPAGALAYGLAYILTVADLELGPSEMDMVDALREALGLDDDRADELIATVSELATPPE